MRLKEFLLVATVVAIPGSSNARAAQTIKVLADQDSAGPHGTNFLSLLMLLMSSDVELLGITTVSGDQWVKPATVFALHALELTGRLDVPVVAGAEMPLLNRGSLVEGRELLYGSHPSWHGSFNPDAPPPSRTWDPPGGPPKLKARPGHAADFIIETLRAHPGEVVLYCAGPLTNLALAVRLAPDIVGLARSIHIMGGSRGGGFELNWWWDPEAAAIVMREPWKEILVTTGELGFEVWSDETMMRAIAESGGRLAKHFRELYVEYESPDDNTQWSAMWDELSVAALLDPSVILKSETLYLDAVIQQGPKYGHSLVWRKPDEPLSFFLAYSGPDPVDLSKWRSHLEPPVGLHPARVYVEADIPRFRELFVDLISR
ncbi:MAG TPA: nucleoside hydrolase [Vicinamibacteria bacterium]|nr:nucleoside hydrolase [Vicinamibacteria bacterium]